MNNFEGVGIIILNIKFKDYLRFIKWHFSYKSVIRKYSVNTLNFENTINLIVKNKLSVSRFGDGEFRFMLSEDNGNTFEVNSIDLSRQLSLVIKQKRDDLLICLPSVYRDLKDLKLESKIYWAREISMYLKKYYKFIDPENVYGDAFFSRPYIEYTINKKEAEDKFRLVKSLWKNRDVIVVEGELTRFGVGNDLLNNTKSLGRIIAPSKNAFERFNEIYNSIKEETAKRNANDVLVLLSLGPTATILASEISKNLCIQAIDIGHLDIEYEWFLRGSDRKVPIQGKYVNESEGTKYLDAEIGNDYYKEIVSEVK